MTKKNRIELDDMELQYVIDALNDQIAEGSMPRETLEPLVNKLTNIKACFVNWDLIDGLSKEEKEEMYNGFCETFLKRPAKP